MHVATEKTRQKLTEGRLTLSSETFIWRAPAGAT